MRQWGSAVRDPVPGSLLWLSWNARDGYWSLQTLKHTTSHTVTELDDVTVDGKTRTSKNRDTIVCGIVWLKGLGYSRIIGCWIYVAGVGVTYKDVLCSDFRHVCFKFGKMKHHQSHLFHFITWKRTHVGLIALHISGRQPNSLPLLTHSKRTNVTKQVHLNAKELTLLSAVLVGTCRTFYFLYGV